MLKITRVCVENPEMRREVAMPFAESVAPGEGGRAGPLCPGRAPGTAAQLCPGRCPWGIVALTATLGLSLSVLSCLGCARGWEGTRALQLAVGLKSGWDTVSQPLAPGGAGTGRPGLLLVSGGPCSPRCPWLVATSLRSPPVSSQGRLPPVRLRLNVPLPVRTPNPEPPPLSLIPSLKAPSPGQVTAAGSGRT